MTAALFVLRGFEVVGVTMRLEDDNVNDRSCCGQREVRDAKAIADQLGIKHYVADFRNDFRAEIESYFVNEYLRGRTPNPCVLCNKLIKFGKLFEFVDYIGADYLATGHYARVVFEDGRYKLKKAVDVRKDQSYVLYNLTAEKLGRIILPLGNMSKAETRQLAEKLKLAVAQKPDSQEVCFVPNDDYKSFIADRAEDAEALKAGEIVDTNGKVLGHHNGVANYTIGQRKGLGIAAETPLYVNRLDVARRQVVVGTSDKLFADELVADNVHWIYEPENFPAKLQAKIRYGYRVAECRVERVDDNINVKFNEPQRAITAGQSVVFYDGDELIGGGVIIMGKDSGTRD